MSTFMDMLNSNSFSIDNPKNTSKEKTGKFLNRSYTLHAFHRNGSEKIVEWVSSRNLAAFRRGLRKEGFYRVDAIEVSSTVREAGKTRKLAFEQIEPRISSPYHLTGTGEVKSEGLPCEKPFIPEVSAKVRQSRVVEHNRVELRRAKVNSSSTVEHNPYKIYNKASGNLVFAGSREECMSFILNNNISISEHVVYMPKKEYAKVVAREK